MSIVLQGSTSGSITLQEPAIAGSTVLSLPATSGTLITTGSTGQVIPKAALPTGSVLQVVQGTTTSATSTSSTSYVGTSLSASITPTSSTSRILVFVNGGDIDTGAAGRQPWVAIFRGVAGNIAMTDAYGDGTRIIVPVSLAVLDSPATTSSVTYDLRVRSGNGLSISFNSQGANAMITLMEIAA